MNELQIAFYFEAQNNHIHNNYLICKYLDSY